MTFVQVLIALAIAYGWSLYQQDVKNVFIYNDFHDEVYVEPPQELHLSLLRHLWPQACPSCLV